MSILVTGGAGYIGSHTVLSLLEQGYDVVVADNLVNASEESLRRIGLMTGKTVRFYRADVRDRAAMTALFDAEKIESVIHFAGLKAVGESVRKPLEYFDNNLISTIVLCEVMREHGVKKLIFSSSATVYGEPASVPIDESFPRSVMSPYGRTKLMIEEMLGDMAKADPSWRIILLRYFNPVGAHESGRIGEDPNGIPNNLMPYITQVAVGKLPQLSVVLLRYFNPVGAHKSGMIGEDPQGIPNNLTPYITQVCIGRRDKVHVFGNDYPTKDGTGVRDYIHVVDLAAGHVAAVKYAAANKGTVAINLGTGVGYSVLDVIHAFEKAVGHEIPYQIDPRRPGDIAVCYADPTKAKELLHWEATRTIDDMCADAWRWQQQNPYGYSKAEDK